MRFLIVDNRAADRDRLMSLLEKLGHDADSAADTQGLLERVATSQYDAVFLDSVDPEPDSYRFLRSLRTHPTAAKQHVIFCSHKKTVLEIDYAIRRAGANDYLIEPVTQGTIRQALEKIEQRTGAEAGRQGIGYQSVIDETLLETIVS